MEIIKREISIRDVVPNGNINIKINLTQNIDGLGMLTDLPLDSYSLHQTSKPNIDLTFEHPTNSELIKHYKKGDRIIMASDSKLDSVRSYKEGTPYIPGFDINRDSYDNYEWSPIDGVSRVTSTGATGVEITYVVDTKKDVNIGTSGQTTGILYVDNPEGGLDINETLDSAEMTTRVEYMSEGWNSSNTSIDPVIQEEYLLGIISAPEVNSDVFIDRGATSILDKHLRLSEIESLAHLTKYGNGFYNINKE